MNKRLSKTPATEKAISIVVSGFTAIVGLLLIYNLAQSWTVWIQWGSAIVLLAVLLVLGIWSLRKALRYDS